MSDKKYKFRTGYYRDYFRITGMWWAGWYHRLDPLREYLCRYREPVHIKRGFDRVLTDDYVKISYDAQKYEQHKSARHLKKLIYDYLLIFDFLNAFHYMEEYIDKKYWNYKKYQRMKQKLEKLLEHMKEALKEREDVIVFWTDCVSYHELEWLPKLNNRGKEALFFESAYTPTPSTRPAMFAMANKWLNIDDFEKDSNRELNYHNSLLLQKVCEYGYEAKYFSNRDNSCVFEKSIQRQNVRQYASSCRACFDAMNELATSDKKQFMIIRAWVETHTPFLYPHKDGQMPLPIFDFNIIDMEHKTGAEYWQMRGAAEYWDLQLDFYSNLLGDLTTKIYMSDHGKVYRQYGNRNWVDRTHHIFLFLQSRYAQNGREKRIFTLEKFSDLVEAVMKAHQKKSEICLDGVFSEPFVRVQRVDTYNKDLVDALKSMHMEAAGHAYRGVRTNEDYYIRFRDCELYYRGGDEETNRIDDPQYAERIAGLRELAGSYFIDIDKNDKFKYARKLY